MPRFDDQSEKNKIQSLIGQINNEILAPLDQFNKFVPVTYKHPMILFIGNHSAGKSSLVNALLGRREQQTGVAPTDDGFTVIMRGESDVTEDGPTAMANQEYGFKGLRRFGSNFVNRFRVKTRVLPKEGSIPGGMMLVDTPGMIDAPIGSGQRSGRGYDFLGVIHWLATRADVILLMFDPANPGTTGETLEVMKLLGDQSRKFCVLLNKVDQFEKVTDFARCYGSLCWNLSKQLPTKDVPRVFTTYTRSDEVTINQRPAVSLRELDINRENVFKELTNAPLVQLDNLLTESEEAARRIEMTGKICKAYTRTVRLHWWSHAVGAGTALVAVPLAFAKFIPKDTTTIGTAVVGVGLLFRWIYKQIKNFESQYHRRLQEIKESFYPAVESNEDIDDRWSAVQPMIEEHVSVYGHFSLPQISSRDHKMIEKVIEEKFPDIRSRVRDYKDQAAPQAPPPKSVWGNISSAGGPANGQYVPHGRPLSGRQYYEPSPVGPAPHGHYIAGGNEYDNLQRRRTPPVPPFTLPAQSRSPNDSISSQ